MAYTIKIGNLDISSFKVGGADCSIYLGDTKLYPTVKYKYKAKYTDGSEYNIECDTSTGLTSADTRVSSYTDVSSVTVGDCIITLKKNSFSGFTSLESVSLPNSLVNINDDAFRSCSSLTSLNIPSTVTYFGNRAFSNCTSLKSINIPSGATSLPLGCFANCYSLEEIEIPSGMATIKSSAFSNCSGLTSVTVLATTPPTIGVSAFNNTNDCPIYVPAQSVQAYKSSWIDYASRIQAIPEPTLQWVSIDSGDTIPKGNIYGVKISSQNAGRDFGNGFEIGTDSDNCAWFGGGKPTRAPQFTAYFYTITNGVSTLENSWDNGDKEFIFSNYSGANYYYEDGTKTAPYAIQLYIYA